MFDDENAEYLVVINEEEQYSIWPAARELPAGWAAEGGPRSRTECLDHIELVWTDMRPKSVREALENAGSLSGQGSRMVLSQLVDADELKAMSPEELREMLASLDDDVIYGEDGDVIEPNPGGETV
ncbi:MbtH family protein [Streptomyces sp. NPDC093111]|uniref:MbtH family protein n=1 Tax=Streptomyces sp. NPDC093111 TaxID=3154978 RepID=UPI00344606D9